MTRLGEWIGGVMFLVGAIQFFVNPRAALDETYRVFVSPSPHIVHGHLVMPSRHREKRR